jgi:outer membrane protein TolC
MTASPKISFSRRLVIAAAVLGCLSNAVGAMAQTATAPDVAPVKPRQIAQNAPSTSNSTAPTAPATPSATSNSAPSSYNSAPDNPNLFLPTAIPEGVPSPSQPIPTGSAGMAGALPYSTQGEAGLKADQRKDDYDVINTQAENFRRRFLQGEAIELKLPMGDQLMPLGSKLPPIRLEASYTQPISLREVVSYCLDNNLAIRIQGEQVMSNKWLTAAQLGRYLPNALMLYRSQYQSGTTLVGGIIPVKFGNPFVNVSAGFQYFGFQGGAVTFNVLSNLHQYRAAKQAYRASINDALNQVTQGYYNLVRNQALLQIQTRAVEVSKAQVQLNRQLERAGTGTRFQVLQSETQLARDQQNLLTQEVGLRNSAIDLATNLNLNATVNLLSVESEVRKVRLIDPSVDINGLINIAFQNRPELKQFKEVWIASKRNVQLQVSSLYPQFQFYGQYAGNGQTLTRQFAYSAPTVTAVQTAGAPTLTQYTSTTGGTPINAANGVANGIASATNPAVRTGQVYNAGYVYNPPALTDRQVRASYQVGMEIDWNFLNMGVPAVANMASAKALARQASLRINQQIMAVLQQVRESYLNSQTAERQIEVATKEVLSSAEELRLARVRLANGVGTNIDVINAQRDFTQALVDKADAIVQFNIQQVQLLHDIGVIGYDTLTSGRLVKAQ